MKKRTGKKWIIAGAIVLLLVLVYLLGPKPVRPDFSTLTYHPIQLDLKLLEDSIRSAEKKLPIKPDNEARIIWNTPFQKTPYSIVYLPGNGASQEEGDPMHEAIAHRYGCNLYLSRLEGLGLIDSNPLLDIQPVPWMQSALDAIAVGHAIGDTVIVMSCSTGSTLALYIAAHFPELIDVMIMLSPNVDVADTRSGLLVKPWGLQLSRIILGSKFYGWKAPGPAQQYWYTRYRTEGLVSLKNLLNSTMTQETFQKVNQPLYMAYYYQDETHQDDVVSVKRMIDMYQQVGTPETQKRSNALADAGTHIIGCDLFNPQLGSLWEPMTQFCEEIVHLSVKDSVDWRPFLDIR